MKTTSLTKRFLPSEDFFNTYSVREQEQLPMLIGANMIFMILFALFGIVLFLFKYPIIGAGGLLLLAFFATSLAFVKKGKIHRASWITTTAIAFLTAIVCFGSPFKMTNFLPYRDSCFIVVMTVCNYIISLRRRQLHGYFLFISLVWIILILIIYKPLFEADFPTAMMNIIICSLAIITTNISVLLFDKFTRNVVERAAENEKKSTQAFEKISKVINETKEGLNIGKQLSQSTDKAADSVKNINDLYDFINTQSTDLNKEAVLIKDSSLQINNKAESMMQSVQNQSNSITQSSAALTQISANINNISTIANQQRAGMNDIIQNLDSQLNLLKKLVDDVQKVKESSKNVSNFVAAVNKIASKTGLLAMNASIEAAHAGSLGKGFSVIAQEIRKLSEESSKNAQKITETLQFNEEIVNTTSESVTNFSEYTQNTTKQLRQSINVVEEILSGISEINSGTQEININFNQIVEASNENNRLAQGVTEEISQQNIALQKISNGSEELKTKVNKMEALLENIRNAINEIDSNASANEIVAAKISGALN
ncbi:MAG: hypothetical protein K5829_13095 [Treponema sp.]|nr:hypothetical protein [Treponema sp.]